MSIRITPGWPWPSKPTAIGLRSTIRQEFGGTGQDAISEYYRGGPFVKNTGDWAAMGSNRNINGKIPTVPGTQIQFSNFIGSLKYANVKWSTEGSVMHRYNPGFNNHEFASISSTYIQSPMQHCGNFKAYEAFPPGFPSTGRYSLRDLMGQLGWPRYIRVRLDNSVSVSTRGDQHERKGSDRYTQVRNAGFAVYFVSGSYRYNYWWPDTRKKIATRDYHKAGYWKQCLKITAYAFSGDDDRWGSGTLTDGSGSGGTGGGGGGGSWYSGGNSSGFSSGSGARVPSNPDTYFDLKAEWDRGARAIYFVHTAEVNAYSCNQRPRYNYVLVSAPRFRFET